jgi:hypothetical protein
VLECLLQRHRATFDGHLRRHRATINGSSHSCVKSHSCVALRRILMV